MDANPDLAAAWLAVEASEARVAPQGAWADPMLSFGLMNRPVAGFGTGERMTMNTLQLSQRIPWPGKLGSRTDRATLLAQAQTADAVGLERDVIERVTTLYYAIAALDRSTAVLRETRELLNGFFAVSSTRYAVGEGLQQDMLQAQIAIARIDEEIRVAEQQRVAHVARLNGVLGRSPDAPVDALEFPEAGGTPAPVDSLMAAAVQASPPLAAARARIDAAEAGYRAARRELYPDLTVSVQYGQRPQFNDMISLMVGVSLPVWAGRKQLPLRRALQAERAEGEARERSVYHETYAGLAEARSEAVRALELLEMYTTAVIPQAQAAVESALSAYRVGRVDYGTLVESGLTLNRYAIERIRLTAQYHTALARVTALVGRAADARSDS